MTHLTASKTKGHDEHPMEDSGMDGAGPVDGFNPRSQPRPDKSFTKTLRPRDDSRRPLRYTIPMRRHRSPENRAETPGLVHDRTRPGFQIHPTARIRSRLERRHSYERSHLE